MRPYILAENNWKTVKNEQYQLVILPWGATEANNFHLPYSTDNVEAAEIAVDNFTLYFRIADYTEIDDVTGKARYSIKDGINGVAGLSKLSEGLKDLQDLVKKEQEAETDLRGGAEIGMLD